MSHLRFNHVFSTLMLLAALSAWFSPSVSDRAQAQLQVLFVPVSKPIYAFASWVHDRASPRRARDDSSPDHPRDATVIIQENNDLRQQVELLRAEVQRLQELNADFDKVGDLRSRCVRVEVAGGDAGLTDTRQLNAGTHRGLADGMPVICPDGVIGRLTKVGELNSRVQLLTDKSNNVTVSFARIEKDAGGHARMNNVSYPDCVATGLGNGKMLIINKPWDALSALKVNDWVMLADKEVGWRNLVYRIGRVSAIQQQEHNPKFGQIEIESSVDPKRLKDVMVVVK
jgi:cell shape-determining protein MreC